MANGIMPYQGGRVLQRVNNGAGEAPAIVEFVNGPGPSCSTPMMLNASNGVVAIPSDAARYLCWLFKGIRRSPQTGKLSSVALTTPEVILPVAGSFQIGPDLTPAQALGKFMPSEWETEAIGRGIYRIKVDFLVRKIAGALSDAAIKESAQNLEFRIIQIGTEDRWSVALNVGDAQDASKSALEPALGGFWLPDGEEFNPYNPTTFAFDFAGTMIGGAGDQYGVRAVIRSFFRDVMC